MYEPVKRLALHLLKAPTEPPAPPAGSTGSVEIFRASPRFLTYRMLLFSLHAVFVVLAELVFIVTTVVSDEPGLHLLTVVFVPVIVVHLAMQYFATRLDFDMRYYIVTDRSVRVRQGAWTVREMTITHANVQNLRVVQGPIERLFGIATLEIDTAGGGGAGSGGKSSSLPGGHTIRMAGIENARDVRDRILAHLRLRGGGTGLGDVDDDAAHRGPGAASPVEASIVPSAMLDALRDLRDAARELSAAAARRA